MESGRHKRDHGFKAVVLHFRHAHDPSHAWSHMASSILGPSLTIPVVAGKLVLGTWQSVMLVELDGPRERTVT